jgi:hypothetical protein
MQEIHQINLKKKYIMKGCTKKKEFANIIKRMLQSYSKIK